MAAGARNRCQLRIVHQSDVAFQYAAEDYRRSLKARIILLMSCERNCLDNAPMEHFLPTLTVERVHARI